jgi:hypothetical protein
MEGEWPQDDRVHDREDRSVSADAERQRHDTDYSECWVLDQTAQSVTNILEHLFPLYYS